MRQALRNNALSYVSTCYDEKLELLQYCLDDNQFNDLTGLLLLPTENKSFQAFESSSYKYILYIYSLEFLKQPLLAANSNILVNLEVENKSLHYKLQLIAEGNYTQLRILTLEAVATLLKNHELFKDGNCPVKSEVVFNNNWLEMF